MDTVKKHAIGKNIFANSDSNAPNQIQPICHLDYHPVRERRLRDDRVSS